MEKFQQKQKYIMNYHYPFYLDVKSSRKMLDEKRRPGSVYYNVLRA